MQYYGFIFYQLLNLEVQTFLQQIFRQICAAFDVIISSAIEQFTQQTYVNGSTKFFMTRTYILCKEIKISLWCSWLCEEYENLLTFCYLPLPDVKVKSNFHLDNTVRLYLSFHEQILRMIQNISNTCYDVSRIIYFDW